MHELEHGAISPTSCDVTMQRHPWCFLRKKPKKQSPPLLSAGIGGLYYRTFFPFSTSSSSVPVELVPPWGACMVTLQFGQSYEDWCNVTYSVSRGIAEAVCVPVHAFFTFKVGPHSAHWCMLCKHMLPRRAWLCGTLCGLGQQPQCGIHSAPLYSHVCVPLLPACAYIHQRADNRPFQAVRLSAP